MKRPTWLLNRTVLAAHRRQLAEHGGDPSFDLPRLALALGWPKTVLAFADARLSLFDLAAAYSEALLRLRPFGSGNERMAYLLGKLFLAINGEHLPATVAEQVTMFRALQASAIGRARYARWMLLRRLMPQGAALIGVARDRSGRVLKIGLLHRSSVRAAAGNAPASAGRRPFNEPLLQN